MRALRAVFSVLVAGLGACASPAKPDAMVPETLDGTKHHPYTVSVASTGGKKTKAMSGSAISDEDFVSALTMAIQKSGAFKAVLSDGKGTYLLEVAIIDLDQPGMGFDMKVTLTTSWKLTHAATKKVVFEEFVDASYTATVGDAFAGIKRVRLANEGAARNNIAKGLRRISGLALSGAGS